MCSIAVRLPRHTHRRPPETNPNPTSFTTHLSKSLSTYISRLWRFADPILNTTEHLRLDIDRDHPDNIVNKLMSQQLHNDEMWFMCLWSDFPAEIDSPLPQDIILED